MYLAFPLVFAVEEITVRGMNRGKLTYCSKVECAEQLGITPRSLENWAKEKGFPRSARKGLKAWCPDVIREWRRKSMQVDESPNSGSGSGAGKKALSQERQELWDAYKLELLEGRARSQTAKSVMDTAEAGRELGLLLPRIAFEAVLAEVLSSVRDFCENLPDRVTQIEGLDDLQRENVRRFLVNVLEPWQNRTADRVETVLADLGPVPELRDLATMSADSAAASKDSDG